MRHFLIDTDTASDDAVALLMALREPDVCVEAITVVAGNCPLDTCVKNALVTVEKANTYAPLVYAGMAKPLMRSLFTAEFVHGDDGMGNMDLPEPDLQKQPDHAVDMIIEDARKFAGELEIVTLGPLSNLAMAILKEPAICEQVRQVTIMGGGGLGPGNITPVAEFNFFVDAEAAQIVMASEMKKMVVGWDVCYDETFINRSDMERLNTLSSLGAFAVRCNASLVEFNKNWNKDGFDLPDPTAVVSAIYPEIISNQFDAYSYVEYQSERSYGQYVIDQYGIMQKPQNATVVSKIHAKQFKDKIFELLA